MDEKRFSATDITIKPTHIQFYIPPVVFKGDPVGHIGEVDVLFWLLEGELALFIGSDCYMMRAGQLAFLPKGKWRRYAALSNELRLYTMGFSAEADGMNLMQGLGLVEAEHVVNIENAEEMTALFEKSSFVGLHKDPISNVIWNANLLNVIKEFYLSVKKKNEGRDPRFAPVIDYMKAHLDKRVTIETLAEMVYMQPTYFIRRFKQNYNVSPMVYFKALQVNRAVVLLLTTDAEIEEIAKTFGMEDASYFSRWFKKSCGLSPAEYRKRFLDSFPT